MADLTITVANIVPVAASKFKQAIAGATILQGQGIYLDSTDSNKAKLCDADLSAADALGAGLAVNSALTGQPVLYQRTGDLGFGAILTAGVTYCFSDTAGGIMPETDKDSGDKIIRIGRATSTSNLEFNIDDAAITVA